MKVSIQVDSARMERTLQVVGERAVQRIEDAVVDAVLAIQRDARQRCPVDTGRLRNSIGWAPAVDSRPAELAYQVGTNVEYGPHVEFGTMYTRPQPYLFPAFYAEMPRFEARLSAALAAAAADAAAAGGRR